MDNAELHLFDVSNPAQPIQLGTLLVAQGEEMLTDVAAGNGFAHVLSTALFPGGTARLMAVDTSVPDFPRREIHWTTPGAPAVAVAGTHLYALHIGSLGIYDLTDPLVPSLVGSAPMAFGSSRDVEVVGDSAYAALNASLAVIDVGDPASPQVLAPVASAATALTYAGDRLYVGTAAGTLEIYDLSDRSAPALLGSLPALQTTRVFDLDLMGDVLFMTQSLVVRAIDVSNPGAPSQLDSIEGFALQSVAIAGEQLYVGGQAQSFVVDASDPANLSATEIFGLGLVRDLELLGNRLYVAGGGSLGVLQVFDISNAMAPALMAGVIAGNQVALGNGIAYTGSTTGSPPASVDFGPEYAPTPSTRIDIAPSSPLNIVNLNPSSNAFIMVVLLGSDDLDVSDVDVSTLAFGPAGASALLSTTSDADQDGHPDLYALFKVAQTGIAITDTEACLTGETVGGDPFEGCDQVLPAVAGCGGGFATALIVPLVLPLGRALRRRRAARA